MDKEILQVLAERLNLTNMEDEPEEYILTSEEEEKVIEHEKDRVKKHKAWNWSQTGAISSEEILIKLNGIDWEKELDRDEILKTANSRKQYDLWQKEQRKKDAEHEVMMQAELEKRCNANYMFNVMAWTSKNEYGKDLIVNDYNRPLIKTVCFFISNDLRFETELGYSFKKGLLIRGISGLGKTHIVKCLEQNEINPILILSMIEITDAIKEEGEFNINMRDKKVIYLDDVGTEETIVNHFGTKISFFKNFIETVYLRNKVYNKLILSTNNNFKEMEEKYGFRVRSRMQEMFNVVNVQGVDMRTA